jgi:DNA-binding SARP family transcriptional activator
LHEGVNVLVVRGCLAGGSPADAVRHFDAYRRRLATELGIRPSAQLLDLIRPLVVPRQR